MPAGPLDGERQQGTSWEGGRKEKRKKEGRKGQPCLHSCACSKLPTTQSGHTPAIARLSVSRSALNRKVSGTRQTWCLFLPSVGINRTWTQTHRDQIQPRANPNRRSALLTIQPQDSPADPFLPPPLLLVPPAETARRGPSRQAVREKKKEQNLSQSAIACLVASEVQVGAPEVNFRLGETRRGREKAAARMRDGDSAETFVQGTPAFLSPTHPYLADGGSRGADHHCHLSRCGRGQLVLPFEDVMI